MVDARHVVPGKGSRVCQGTGLRERKCPGATGGACAYGPAVGEAEQETARS